MERVFARCLLTGVVVSSSEIANIMFLSDVNVAIKILLEVLTIDIGRFRNGSERGEERKRE